MSTLIFELARRRYLVRGLTHAQSSQLRARFGDLERATPGPLATVITVAQSHAVTSFRERPPGPTEYRLGVRYASDAVHVEGVGFRARIERATFETHMVTCRDDAWFVDGFENLFRVVVSYVSFEAGAMVLHSAAFTDGRRGFLCCGRSGAGKTTLCSLADALGLDVLSDELNLVDPNADTFELRAMPFAGDFGRTSAGDSPLPLSALLGLRQDSVPGLGACSRAQAVSRIVASCPYLNADPAYVERVADRATELASQAPLRVLSFALDTSFWKVLDHEYSNVHHAVSP